MGALACGVALAGCATVEEAVDVRIICATHQNLQRRVESGQFRQDLYYRLAVIELQMPSLRDCREDIPDIAEAVLKKLLGRNGGTGVPSLSAKALEALKQYDFPGNVRELENILERAVALAGGEEISLQDLQLSPPSLGPDLGASSPGSDALPVSDAKWPLQEYLDRLEQEAILEALAQTKFNRTAAARLLGITFRALRYRMARLGIQ